MKNSPDAFGNGAPEDRFAGQVTYRTNQRRDSTGLPGQPGDSDRTPPPLDDMSTMPSILASVTPSISINDLETMSEPVFGAGDWLDDSPTGTMADHPLLRGLLMELPPKGAMPDEAWLDRWFDAARSILDLLYAHHAGRALRR
ncbi:MAG TPA: hypothetical protein VFR11_02390 [Micromonosporaceae bacterium]|jgi:hypothetical protein|nr:hypothetical protein [Micromonosporaceae bacterium]